MLKGSLIDIGPPRRMPPVAALVKGGLALAGLVLVLVVVFLALVGSGDEHDGAAQLACANFRQLLHDMPLPPAMLQERIDGIYQQARSATTPGVAFGGHVLLITGDMTRLEDACRSVQPL